MTVKDLISHMVPDERVSVNIIGCGENNELEIVARSDDIRDKTPEYDQHKVVSWLLRHHTLQIIVKA